MITGSVNDKSVVIFGWSKVTLRPLGHGCSFICSVKGLKGVKKKLFKKFKNIFILKLKTYFFFLLNVC